jgi:long-chain acyl-CoA synthetase
MVIGDKKDAGGHYTTWFWFYKEWAVIHKIDIGATNEDIGIKRKVIARIQEEIDLLNVKFGTGASVLN